MGQETTTEYDVVERDVEVTYCDDCGETLGPTDEAETVPILIGADAENREISDLTFNVMRDLKQQNESVLDDYRRHHGPSSSARDALSTTGFPAAGSREEQMLHVRAGVAKLEDVEDVLDRWTRKMDPGDITAHEKRDVCRACAVSYGLDQETADELAAADDMDVTVREDDPLTHDERVVTRTVAGRLGMIALLCGIGAAIGFAASMAGVLAGAFSGAQFGVGAAVSVFLFLLAVWLAPPSEATDI